MMGAWILTMVVMMNGHLTSFSVGYDSKEACETAKVQNREALSQGSIILSTCTRRS